MPHAIVSCSGLANRSSTWVSHELQVGVSCSMTRGRAPRHAVTTAVSWAGGLSAMTSSPAASVA